MAEIPAASPFTGKLRFFDQSRVIERAGGLVKRKGPRPTLTAPPSPASLAPMKTAFPLVGIALALSVACERPAAATAPKASETPAKVAPKAKPFERFDGCRLIPNRWNDGDSFHIRTADGREIVARLYFVDTPEVETAYRDRIAEQAAYFGISVSEAATVAREAAAFTVKRLAGTFTVWTRWRDALGRSALVPAAHRAAGRFREV